MNRSTGMLIIIAIALMAGGLSYWTGFLSTETGSGTGTDTGSELLEIVNVTSRKIGENLYLDLIIENKGTIDAKLEYIVANGSIIDEEDRLIPYGAQIEIAIPVHFESNSTLIMRFHTKSGKEFEEIFRIPEPEELKFVNIEMPTAYAEAVEDGWEISFIMKNTGSGDTAIDRIDVNLPVTMPKLPIRLDSGDTVTVNIFLSSDEANPGNKITVKVHTTEGKEYLKQIELP